MKFRDYTDEQIGLANGFINNFPESAGSEGLAEYYKESTKKAINPKERRTIVKLIALLRKGESPLNATPFDKLAHIICESFDYKNEEINNLKRQIEILEGQVELAEDAVNISYRAEEQKTQLLSAIDHLELEVDRLNQRKNDIIMYFFLAIYAVGIAILLYFTFTNFDNNHINILLLED